MSCSVLRSSHAERWACHLPFPVLHWKHTAGDKKVASAQLNQKLKTLEERKAVFSESCFIPVDSNSWGQTLGQIAGGKSQGWRPGTPVPNLRRLGWQAVPLPPQPGRLLWCDTDRAPGRVNRRSWGGQVSPCAPPQGAHLPKAHTSPSQQVGVEGGTVRSKGWLPGIELLSLRAGAELAGLVFRGGWGWEWGEAQVLSAEDPEQPVSTWSSFPWATPPTQTQVKEQERLPLPRTSNSGFYTSRLRVLKSLSHIQKRRIIWVIPQGTVTECWK